MDNVPALPHEPLSDEPSFWVTASATNIKVTSFSIMEVDTAGAVDQVSSSDPTAAEVLIEPFVPAHALITFHQLKTFNVMIDFVV